MAPKAVLWADDTWVRGAVGFSEKEHRLRKRLDPGELTFLSHNFVSNKILPATPGSQIVERIK